MDAYARRLPSIDALTDPASLSARLGPVDDLRIEPLQGAGYSNASLERVRLRVRGGILHSFVLKRADLDKDWTARRSGDGLGREALLGWYLAVAGAGV